MTGAFFFAKIAQMDWEKLQSCLGLDASEMKRLSHSFSIAYQEHAFYKSKSWTDTPKPVDWLGNPWTGEIKFKIWLVDDSGNVVLLREENMHTEKPDNMVVIRSVSQRLPFDGEPYATSNFFLNPKFQVMSRSSAKG